MIDYVNKNPGCRSRKVASVINFSTTQIQGIIEKRAEIMGKFEKNGPENRKRHKVEYNAELTEAIYRLYCLVRESKCHRDFGPPEILVWHTCCTALFFLSNKYL